MNTERSLSDKSKKLSWILRHGANEIGLAMDTAGWARVDDVLRHARMTRVAFDEVVRSNNKSRLEVQGDRVRAVQGHSLDGTPVTLEGLESSWRAFEGKGPVFHGTNFDALAGIDREGILNVSRTHVHLAEAVDSRVGKRATVDVLLEVDCARMREEGVGLFVSPNGVVLCRHVPRRAIVAMVPMTRRARETGAAYAEKMSLAWRGA